MRACVPLSSSKGSTLAIVMLGLAVLGICSIVITRLNAAHLKSNKQINVRAVAEQIKQKLVGAVISPESWQLTQAQNPAAFQSQSYNAAVPTPAQKLDVHLAGQASTLYYASSQSHAGFDRTGEPCSSFDPQNGNDDCPFHYEVRLIQHAIQNGNWVDRIHFELQYKPATENFPLNTSQSIFTFDMDRNFDSHSVETSCISLNGNYNPQSAECSVKLTPSPAIVCANSTPAYRGPASTAAASCASIQLPATNCSPGSAVTGFSSTGNPICSAL